MENKNQIAVSNKDLITFKNLDELRKYSDEVASTGFTPLKTGAKVMAAILTGQELGFGAMFSANNIHPVNGRATLGIHAINKKLLEAGIVTEILKDFQPCVKFLMKGEDNNPLLDGKDGKTGDIIVTRIDFLDEDAKDYEIKGKKIFDWKTVVKMTRTLKQPDGSFKTMTVIDSFSYGDAVTAGLSEKDNWKNYSKKMCETRATVFCARRIADDILGGLPETSEYADVKNVPYVYEEGKVTILQDEQENIKTSNVVEATVVEEVLETASSETDIKSEVSENNLQTN